jgi:O-antigen/teichoic acid export membrane protein
MNKAVIGLFLTKAYGAFINLLILFVTVRMMGAEQRGLISMFVLELSFVMLAAEWVVGPVLVYYVNKHSLKSIIQQASFWIISVVLISIITLYCIHPNLNLWLYAFIFLIQCFISFHNQLLLANHQYLKLNVSQIIQSTLLFSLLAIHINLGEKHLSSYLHSMLVSYALVLILQVLFISKLNKNEHEPGLSFQAILKSGGYTTFTNLFHLITNRNSFVLVSAISGAAVLGIYSTSVSMAEAMLLAASSIGMFVYSRVAATEKLHSKKDIYKYMGISAALTVLFILIVMIIPNEYFEWVLGKDFTGVKSLILQLSPGVFCMAIIQVLSHYFSGKGNFKLNFWAGLISTMIMILCGKYAIHEFGLPGIIAATNLAIFSQLAVLLLSFLFEGKRNDLIG